MDAGIIIRCLKAHYRKNIAEMLLLAFEGKKEFKVDILEAIKLRHQAWIYVSEKSIQNCFAKVHFASTSEENQEITREPEKGVSGRFQTAVSVPQSVIFNEYVEGDVHLVSSETITASSIRNDITANEVPTDDEEDDDENCLYEPEPTPFMALEVPKTLDRDFKAQDNSDTMLSNVSKMLPKWQEKPSKQTKTKLRNFCE